jgi:hypothetical protein
VGNRRPDKRQPKTEPTAIDTDPERLAVRLLAYAIRRAASLGWKAEDSVLARGQGVEDVVQDAIASLSGGDKRKRWDPATTPDPMDHLRPFVNSRLSTLSRSYENRKVKYQVDTEAHPASDDPLNEVMDRQLRPWRQRAADLLVDAILGDDLLLRLYDLLEGGGVEQKPAALAAQLGVPVAEVKNALKRFWRAWERVRQVLARELLTSSEVKNA